MKGATLRASCMRRHVLECGGLTPPWPNGESAVKPAHSKALARPKSHEVRWAVFASLLLLSVPAAPAADNLVVNGSFDYAGDSLHGWKYKYDLPGESWYFDNHKHVSVVDRDGPQNKVLALWGDLNILQTTGQGTKVDSDPIAVKPGSRYRFSAKARSSGPNCRVMLEGYRWRPGIKPHDHPALFELRRG